MTLQRLKLIIVDDKGPKTVEFDSYAKLKKYALSEEEGEKKSEPVNKKKKKKKLIKNKLQEKIQENKMEDAEESSGGDRKKSFWDKLK